MGRLMRLEAEDEFRMMIEDELRTSWALMISRQSLRSMAAQMGAEELKMMPEPALVEE